MTLDTFSNISAPRFPHLLNRDSILPIHRIIRGRNRLIYVKHLDQILAIYKVPYKCLLDSDNNPYSTLFNFRA